MKILIYNLKFNQLAAVNKACSVVGADIITLKKEDLHNPIESILYNKKPFSGKDKDCVPSELLVFSGFTDDALDLFLEAYNSTGAPKIIYKATTTPINEKWTPAYLYYQLTQEVMA